MRRASELFTVEDKKRIEETVREAESKTSGEIVPVAATASGRYDRPEDIVGFWGAVLLFTITWFWLESLENGQTDWGFSWTSYRMPLLILAMLLGFPVGVQIGMRVMVIRHFFTPRRQMREEVAARARQIFFDQRVHHTQSTSGVLIYLSLYERMAAVIADSVVFDRVGQATLDDLCRQITNSMKQKPASEALCSGIRSAGECLARVLPHQAQDVDELPDALVIFD
jgi:putative membrane protein